MIPERLLDPADLALLLTYAAVCGYFLRRFYLKQKWPSLFIALLPMGWVLLAIHHEHAEWLVWAKWAGVAIGALLMLAVLQTDRTDSRS